MLHRCVSPSDASPDGKWLAGCLKGIEVWQLQCVSVWERLIVFIQNSPVKFPVITYGMMPSGHTRSGLDVAALLQRRRLCLSAALWVPTLSLEDELLTVRSAWWMCWFSFQINKFNPALIPESVWLVWTACCASSLLWTSLNMRRSSSSSAISPKKAAGNKHTNTKKSSQGFFSLRCKDSYHFDFCLLSINLQSAAS